MDILYLVDRLENLIAGSRRMPLFNQLMLKESDILNIIEQMRTAIPDEIKQSRRIIQDKERILAQAQADASTLLARAREESERAMNREGLLRAAEDRSKDMVRKAEEQSEQIKIEADAYVAETLRALREHLSSIEMEVGRSILSIEKGLASMGLEPGDADEIEEEPDASYPDGEVEEILEIQEAPPATQSRPRRSSLAADTMGGPMYMQDAPPRRGQ
jgi:cell division septum initiation protein DivIVA